MGVFRWDYNFEGGGVWRGLWDGGGCFRSYLLLLFTYRHVSMDIQPRSKPVDLHQSNCNLGGSFTVDANKRHQPFSAIADSIKNPGNDSNPQ